MTYNEELSVLECISRHYKSIFKNDESVNFNEGYGFWWFSWVMPMNESSLSRPMILSTHIKWVSIYFDLFKIYTKINFFFHNSGSNQDIFILFEDLSSMDLGLFVGYLNL